MSDKMTFHSRQFEQLLLSMLPEQAQDVSIVINREIMTRQMPHAGFYTVVERTGEAVVTITINYYDPALVRKGKE